MDIIDNIVARLSEVIPRAWKAHPKEQGSWRTLKVGDTLVRTSYGHVFTTEAGTVSPGAVITVTAVDSQGMWYKATMGGSIRWATPDWKLYFTKVKKARGKS